MVKVDYALLLVHLVCHINIVNLMNLDINVLIIVVVRCGYKLIIKINVQLQRNVINYQHKLINMYKMKR